MRSILPITSCKQLYFALVHPHIVYGVELYANTNDSYIDPLVKMNNKILRILQNKKNELSCDRPVQIFQYTTSPAFT